MITYNQTWFCVGKAHAIITWNIPDVSLLAEQLLPFVLQAHLLWLGSWCGIDSVATRIASVFYFALVTGRWKKIFLRHQCMPWHVTVLYLIYWNKYIALLPIFAKFPCIILTLFTFILLLSSGSVFNQQDSRESILNQGSDLFCFAVANHYTYLSVLIYKMGLVFLFFSWGRGWELNCINKVRTLNYHHGIIKFPLRAYILERTLCNATVLSSRKI